MEDNGTRFTIVDVVPADVPLILSLIRELAEYEELANEVTATEARLHAALFGPGGVAHAVVARTSDGTPAGEYRTIHTDAYVLFDSFCR